MSDRGNDVQEGLESYLSIVIIETSGSLMFDDDRQHLL